MLQAGHGRGQRPAFPAPSSVSRAGLTHNSGADAPREMMAHVCETDTFGRSECRAAVRASWFETPLRGSSP
ncbi:hypothetical protein BRAO285_380017 [Bradyrhizobium sp. ORS 285]|nr:hypothetical protein BRAO285_380017 [Bradyrhizobium sp. ORS 285]